MIQRLAHNFAVIHVLFLCQPCARCSFTCTGPGSPLEGLDHVSWSSGGRLDHQITTKEIIIAYFFRNPHVLVHVQTACTCNHVVILRDPIRCSTRIAHTHVLSPHFQLILHAIQVIYIYICTESAGFIYIYICAACAILLDHISSPSLLSSMWITHRRCVPPLVRSQFLNRLHLFVLWIAESTIYSYWYFIS